MKIAGGAVAVALSLGFPFGTPAWAQAPDSLQQVHPDSSSLQQVYPDSGSVQEVYTDSSSLLQVYPDSDSVQKVYTDSSGLVITSPASAMEVAAAPVDENQWPDPTITLFKSMLLPGWGQITNKRYVKAAIAIGLEAWFLTGAIVNSTNASRALDDFRADPNNLNHYYDYQYYWGNRSDFLWLFGITVFVSMFDAYVDAHLRPYQSDTIPGVDPPKGLKIVIPF